MTEPTFWSIALHQIASVVPELLLDDLNGSAHWLAFCDRLVAD